MYVVGGYDGQNRLSSVECYDSFSNRWTEVAPLKEAVSSPAVTSCVGKLFVIGGGPDDNTCSDKVSHILLQKLPMIYTRREIQKAYQGGARSLSVKGLFKIGTSYFLLTRGYVSNNLP